MRCSSLKIENSEKGLPMICSSELTQKTKAYLEEYGAGRISLAGIPEKHLDEIRNKFASAYHFLAEGNYPYLYEKLKTLDNYINALESTEDENSDGGNTYEKIYRYIRSTNERFEESIFRSLFVPKYSWSIPTQEAIQEIVSCGPVIEIGAGSGYWAHLVQKAGGDIVPFDKFLGEDNEYGHRETWTDVLEGGNEVISLYPDHALFLSWPSYDEDWGAETLETYIENGGKTLIYVGESMGGCCANGRFFELINQHFRLKKKIELPQWYGIYDNMYIYERIGEE